jgi:hypothetical protein
MKSMLAKHEADIKERVGASEQQLSDHALKEIQFRSTIRD